MPAPEPRSPAPRIPSFNAGFFLGEGWPYLLVPFIPLAVALKLGGASDAVVFVAAALGIIPTAALMGRATEELASRSGAAVGGFLNVTFGNAPELIIALFALGRGLHELVKATLIGSVIGNILLVLGAAMFVGGLGRDGQRFSRRSANAQSRMLVLAAVAFAVPAVVQLAGGDGLPRVGPEHLDFSSAVEVISGLIAAALIVVYVFGLLASLRNARESAPDYEQEGLWGLSVRTSVAMLAVAGGLVGVMSEVLVGSIHAASESLGLSEFFIGAVVVAIVGNAAEHWVAVLVARKGHMDLSVNIAIGSAAQVALFVAPVLVLAGFFIGPAPLPLVFNAFELGAVFLAVGVAYYVAHDGHSTWREGVLLLALYAILVVVFALA
jgi:Ca2+:H+ antiporter